jgi:hypothetical protein
MDINKVKFATVLKHHYPMEVCKECQVKASCSDCFATGEKNPIIY